MTVALSNESVLRRATVFLSLLPPTARDRRLAVVLVAVSTMLFLLLAPFAKVPLTPVPAFIPTYQAALFINDLITAAVLFSQFSVLRTRALLILASAYLFTAAIIVPHTLTFPGVFAAGGLLGAGSETTSWLYIAWHAGFPLLVLGYVLTKHDNAPLSAPLAAALASVAAVVVVVVAIAFLTTAGQAHLPKILDNNRYTPFARGFMPLVCGLSILTFAALWWRRPHSTLDTWMTVVMSAWVFEVGTITMLIGGRYDLGFYAGRVYGLFAASFVLVMVLLETRALYSRLARDLSDSREIAQLELSRSRELYRMLFETNPYAVSVSDRETQRIVAVNEAAVAQYGWSREEFLTLRVTDFIPPEELPALLAKRREFSSTSRRIEGLRHRRKNGTLIDVDIVSRVIEYDGRPAVLTITTDVSERRATEEQLRQSQKMEAIGQLTGGVAHDFNNILMVIMANVEELLEDEGLSTTQRELLSRIGASGERAAELTQRLLAFSRKQRLVPQATNLTELVSGIGKLLRRTLGEQIEIEAVFADDLWTTNVDRAQVEAALVNLCVNARDAMPKGGRLLIETANRELDPHYAEANPGAAAGEYVMLAVSDTGIGIAPENLSKVFDPFFTTKEVGKGTGLGLSMVYGFIKQSNGHIKIYSELGHGTTIRMYLPRSDAPGKDEARTAPRLLRGKERVLLVEDDEQVRAAVLGQLRSLGYAVTEAAGGPMALERLEAGDPFHLMLTDMVMPALGGPELARIARERWPQMKVLFMSGYSENATRTNGAVSPDAHILSKPFRKSDLATRIREVLDGG